MGVGEVGSKINLLVFSNTGCSATITPNTVEAGRATSASANATIPELIPIWTRTFKTWPVLQPQQQMRADAISGVQTPSDGWKNTPTSVDSGLINSSACTERVCRDRQRRVTGDRRATTAVPCAVRVDCVQVEATARGIRQQHLRRRGYLANSYATESWLPAFAAGARHITAHSGKNA